jgi:hypothetical protein
MPGRTRRHGKVTPKDGSLSPTSKASAPRGPSLRFSGSSHASLADYRLASFAS